MPARTSSLNRFLWIVPEERGGIRTYAEALLPAFDNDVSTVWNLADALRLEPAMGVIHLQHEFGLFGSKIPGLYRFPSWMRKMKRRHPEAKWIATAHNVIAEDYRFAIRTRGWRAVLRKLANSTVLPMMRRTWSEATWGEFDGVIVHSRFQAEAVRRSGCPNVWVIPHYVPKVSASTFQSSVAHGEEVVLFGYFCIEKGQDIAIRAWAKLGAKAPKLVLAGGIRRPEDESYLAECRSLIASHNLEGRVEITGFIPAEQIDTLYANAKLVIAPFRETTGSGSLATAFSRSAAILASDLPLNRELSERVPGCLAYFRSDDVDSLAEAVLELLDDAERLRSLRAHSKLYTDAHLPERMAALHRKFYREVLG